MDQHLLIAVHLHADGMGTARYHGMYQGAPEWPPAPARIFQALVAGVAQGQALPDACIPALQWLERLPPPLIAAPLRTVGQTVSIYVPNNDADILANPVDLSGIRTAKQVQPSLFDGAQPLLYAWCLPAGEVPLPALAQAAHGLYQLGRGVDMAWADAHVLSDDELRTVLQHYRGALHHPSPSFSAQSTAAAPHNLACPAAGSLDSLVQRHHAPRLRTEGAGKKARVLFTNAPKPRFATISYAPVRRLALYEIRERGTTNPWPWGLHRAVQLVEQVRDAVAARLRTALPDATELVERCLIGRAPDGMGAVPLIQRIRIMPLPSIGSLHADHAIRRLLVEVPSACPIAFADLDWAFSGLDRVDPDTGETSPWLLTKAERLDMQTHHTAESRYWQSVTAVALPEAAARRRIDPSRQVADAKPAGERLAEEKQAVLAVHRALRHAGVSAVPLQVRVQREPFNGLGQRAESFAENTRFEKERMWHVAIGFDRPVAGPLAIGDGRFLGLGLMAPGAQASRFRADPAAWTGEQSDGVFALQAELEGAATAPGDSMAMARALRRAVMARVRDTSGTSAKGALDPYFSGHAADSDAPDARASRHLAFHWDATAQRWLLMAPHRLQRRIDRRDERQHLSLLDRALEGLTEIKAGAAGRFNVQRVPLSALDDVLRPATTWVSRGPYTVTRHLRLASAADAVTADVLAECSRQKLPVPVVTVLKLRAKPGQGLQAHIRLQFATALAGPLALGRTALLGGGLFSAAD